MDKLTAIETDLSKAREALTALQDELPQFRALLSENEQDAQRLKTERASLNEQAQARGRVQIAKEMLEQHQSDIVTARAEVVRLEALERRVLILQQIATHAQRTTKHRKKLEKTVHETSAALGQALEQMAQVFSGTLLGRDLAPEFYGHVPFGNGIQEQEKKAVCEALLSDLEERGATLTDVLNTTTGRHSRVDRDTQPLPNPKHAYLLWQIFSEKIAKRDRYIFHNVYLPVKPQPVQAPVTTLSDNRYSI